MSDCRIRAASDRGAHVLRLEGDVRLTLCTALDDYFERIFADPGFTSVWVDLTGATGVDSTTLGMLAQLALKTEAKYGFKPTIYATDSGINRLLRSMGFEQLFDLRTDPCLSCDCSELPAAVPAEHEIKDKVIAAHRTLMSLSSDNEAAFSDLVRTLEAS